MRHIRYFDSIASLFGAILSLCLASNTAMCRPIGPNDQCVGPALVRPEGGLYGTIYFSDVANDSGGFPRRGYLPSNMVVVIDDPPPERKGKFHDRYCHFNYRNVISGYLERINLISLTGIANSVGLNIDNVAGFVGAANPQPDKRLRLYRTDRLADNDVIKDLGRNDAAIIFLLAQNPTPDTGALKVVHIADPDRPAITEAYIRASEDRSYVREDGSINFGGTFRVYKPRLDKAYASIVMPAQAGGASEYLQYILEATVSKIKQAIGNVENAGEKLTNMTKCQEEETITLESSLKSDLGSSMLSFGAAGKGEVKWTKPAGEVEQFAHIGERDEFRLIVHGIAACSKEVPAYLSQAHIVIAGDDDAEKGNFIVDRDEFFIAVHGDPIPENFKDKASLVNLQRPLSQLFVVPRIDGETSPFYYSFFDRVERYMDENVFGARQLNISSEDKFALTLLIAESLGYWQ